MYVSSVVRSFSLDENVVTFHITDLISMIHLTTFRVSTCVAFLLLLLSFSPQRVPSILACTLEAPPSSLSLRSRIKINKYLIQI